MKYLRKALFFSALIIFCLTPIIWFWGKGGNVLINGIDTNFPLDPWIWFTRRLHVWTDFPNAGVDFSSSTAGLFFHSLQTIPFKLGLSLQYVQIISLVFWFSIIIFSSFVLSRIIFYKSKLTQLLFVVIYSFNIYLYNTWENVKVANLSLIASIPLGVSVLLLLNENKMKVPTALFLSSLMGIILSGSGINPSYFITFILIIFIISISQILSDLKVQKVRFLIRNSLAILLPLILVNIFWIIPTLNFVLWNIAPQGSIDKLGLTNWVDSLSENTSLLNVMRLQGAWDWYIFDSITGLPLYIPYALNYLYKLPFVVFSFLLPTLAILSLCFRRKGKNYLYVAFGLMMVLGVFLGAGTHLPTGDLFRWVSVHVPFFTFFRSPWYIFTPLVILAFAGLAGLLFQRVNEYIGNKNYYMRFLLNSILFIFVLSNLIYSYPLITGKIFRPDSPNGFFVSFPSYIFEAKSWLDKNKMGRIIGYPDDEIEQFNWGYRGIESILGLITDQEVLFNPLNAPDSNIALLLKQFYKHLRKGEIESASNLAKKMNVGIIFEKGDEPSLAPPLTSKAKINPAASFGPWSFYRFPNDPVAKINVPTRVFSGPIQKDGGRVISVIPKDGILLNRQDSFVKNSGFLNDYLGIVVLAKNSQEEELNSFIYAESRLDKRLVSRDLFSVEFVISIPEDGNYNPIIERYGLESFGIEIDKKLEVELDGKKVVLEPENLTDSYLQFRKINLSSGEHKIRIALKNENLVSGGDFNSGITFKEGGYGEGQAKLVIIEEAGNKYLQIFNIGKANVSADFIATSFDYFIPYHIEFKYKQIYGNNGNAVILQNTGNTLVKAQTERMPNYPEWNKFSFYYLPVQTESNMKITLESPFTVDPLGTKVLYDDLVVRRVFTNSLLFEKEGKNTFPSIPEIEFSKKSPDTYEGKISKVSNPYLLVFSENYSPNWQISFFDKEGKDLNINPKHFSANLFANAWLIETVPEISTFKIYYKTQKIYFISLLISLFSLIFFFTLFIIKKKYVDKT